MLAARPGISRALVTNSPANFSRVSLSGKQFPRRTGKFTGSKDCRTSFVTSFHPGLLDTSSQFFRSLHGYLIADSFQSVKSGQGSSLRQLVRGPSCRRVWEPEGRPLRLETWNFSRGAISVKSCSMTGAEGPKKKGAKKKTNENVNKSTNQKSIASFFGGGSKVGNGAEKTAAKQSSINSFFANERTVTPDTSVVHRNKSLSSISPQPPVTPALPPQCASSEDASTVDPRFPDEAITSDGAEEAEPKVYQRRKRRVMVGTDDEEDMPSSPSAPSPSSPLVTEGSTLAELKKDGEDVGCPGAAEPVKTAAGVGGGKKRRRLCKTGDLNTASAPPHRAAVKEDQGSTNSVEEGEAQVAASGSLDNAGERGERSGDDESGDSGEEADLDDDLGSDLEVGGGAVPEATPAKKAATSRKRKVATKKGAKASKVEGVSDGLVALAVKSKDYDAAGAATWKPGESVPFSYLAQALEAISKESKRLLITELLCNVFRTVIATSPQDLVPVVYLVANRVAPPHEGVEMGIGDATIIKALAEATGRKETQIKSEYKECGDLGLVAKTSRMTQRTMFTPQPITCAKLLEQFREIAKESGHDKKKVRMKALIVAARDNEAQFIVRLLQGKMRIGLAEQTVLAALAQAAVMQETPTVSQPLLPARLDEAQKLMKEAYHMLPVVDLLVKAILEGGVSSLPSMCPFTLGVPVGPMLAKPTKGISEILDKFQDTVFTCEYKYDGERAQIHCMEDGTVEIYSRNAEHNTQKFPDLVMHINKHKRPTTTSFVLDCEAVAYDRELKRILPFQVLSTRGRKGVLMSDIKVQVCLYAFDLLYFNGRSLLQEQLNRRRKLLYEAFEEVEGEFQFATAVTTRDIEEIQTFLNEAVNSSCEGVMVKTLEQEATYEPAKRSNNWLKLKKDYMGGLGDSLDLVPIGGFHGKGKRAGVFGAFLLACYDEAAEEYQSICKVGTGFSEVALEERSQSLRSNVRDGPAAYYRVADSMQSGVDVWFDPCQVWEVKAADLSISPVHRAGAGIVDPNKGIALRFPRFLRGREDKTPEQATTAEQVADMYRAQKIHHRSVIQSDED